MKCGSVNWNAISLPSGNQLECHQLAEWEQSRLQAFQKKTEAQYHQQETGKNFFQVGDGFAQDEQLEAEDNQGNRQHVPDGAEDCVKQVGEYVHQPGLIPACRSP
jgi:hypothetical protein